MSLPMPANITCDIYHGQNLPPAPPDVPGATGYLEEDFRNLKPAINPIFTYTHILRVETTVDVRDGYSGVPGGSAVYVSNQSGTRFQVQAVARVGRGTAVDHKIVYLQRINLTWPSNDV
ncbi:MAG TPA: hypothetical protein DDY78_19010 [Planctomycetales bacterium]|jgi:hypothetical protein|nr:hypothetical protein [Planctomycetales bacterium]